MGPRPKIFVPMSDEGARGNNVRGPGTTVNPGSVKAKEADNFPKLGSPFSILKPRVHKVI